jgi:hypothetical protein
MRSAGTDKEKTCEHCGKPLFGRTDKRFCNDTCRNTFNRIKTEKEKLQANENIPEIFRIIKKNYEILRSYDAPHQKDSFIWLEDKTELLKQGYNDKFYTNSYAEPSGPTWHCCFEIGVSIGDSGAFIKYLPEQAELK